MSTVKANKYDYVFTSVNEAIANISEGSETEPMILHIAPYVYWIDDPDDDSVRVTADGGIPYGLVVDNSWITFHGLSKDPKNVVLACNRGQTQGAVGNFTMFRFNGDGISTENITLGNYCNVDLDYELKPSLSRKKRFEAIAQAQLALCSSDKIYAHNSNFISRLNSCPFVGSKRALFDHCYFECTDDALCGNAVYFNCNLKYFSSKPFWSTSGTGAVFLNCDFDIVTQGTQYFTKVGSQVVLVDCRFNHATDSLNLAWTQYTKDYIRCYQYNVTLNGEPVFFQKDRPCLTVDLEGKKMLEAFKIEHKGDVIYNVYGLLRANDNWDPLCQREKIEEISALQGVDYTSNSVCMKVLPRETVIESGVTCDTLFCKSYRFYNIENNDNITWSVAPEFSQYVRLQDIGDGSCIVSGTNNGETPVNVMVQANNTTGVEAACVVSVLPKYLPSPKFTKVPSMESPADGQLTVDYKLALGNRADHSLITWYRCDNARGTNALEVAVSRLDKPEYSYKLVPGDIGHYIMARVEPKHIRSHKGNALAVTTIVPISKDDVKSTDFETDFQNFPTTYQDKIIEGGWTVDSYKPIDTKEFNWEAKPVEAWRYGKAEGGAVGFGLLQTNKGSRLLYTPIEGSYGDMKIKLSVDPCKTAGQGFGSATGQYMDIYIKFDTRTLSGYALRIVRTTKYANAVDFVLMEYKNGETREICEPVSASCYRTGCNIEIESRNDTLSAHIKTTTPRPENANPNVVHEVDLLTPIEANSLGGSGIQHTGSAGSGATMLHYMSIQYKNQ